MVGEGQRKAIFITGGGSGIGRAVAQRFAASGWRIGLAGIHPGGLEETGALLPEGCATTHIMDVRDVAAWEEELEVFTQESAGRLDVLFNNADIALGGPLAETGIDEIERIVAINFTGVVFGARIAYQYLARTPGSCLLNTSSAAGLYGTSGAALYSATKFAVRGLTEALDGEWSDAGIKVRSLMPGFVDAPLLDSNENMRVRAVGLESSLVEEAAEKAWRAVHGDVVHTPVGKTARRMKFAARWLPGSIRRQMRRGL
ncbi:SDR family oxidoreductase [Stakelama saccharophila]|uniref:SDR family oxidoreductase n=1 Tax=Stakelama saccharophila TaxID=3075605 RepID=A0ABZ0BAU5_9SPHN|nr:SDR family oxidoreductase [Stakelama sp. W311]WNO54509.1 SDR family oxidoreductase [Stakelama sp. W311]